jgi:tetratricopeptide (TPR) repeat protein
MQFVDDSPPNTRDKNLVALKHPKVSMPPDQLMTLRILHDGSDPLIPLTAGAIGDSARFDEIRNKMRQCMRARLRYLEALESRNAGLLPQAISVLREASKLCPNNGIYRIHLADYLLHYSQAQAAAGRTEEAIDAARRSIEAHPSGHRGFYQLGSLEADRRPAVGIALLGKAIELNPHYVPGYLLKAQTELISGEAEEASRTLGAALSVEPLNLTAHHLRALSFIERDMLDEARVEIDRVIRAEPDNVEALDALAYTWLMEGDLDRAEELYQAVLRRRPDHLTALNNYGTILAEKGDLEGAVRTWTKALSLDPGNRDIIDNIEEARQKMRRR